MTAFLTAVAMMLPYNGERGVVEHDPDHRGHHRGCQTYRCDRRVQRKLERRRERRIRHRKWLTVRPYDAKLTRIARCESGLRWHIATGNGFYGGLQFTIGTWRSVGGSGMPHWHTPLEQKYRAVKVYKRRGGWGDWPVCGYR